MRAALQDLAGDPALRIAGIDAVVLAPTAWVLGNSLTTISAFTDNNDTPALNSAALALQHLEAGVRAIAPEANIEALSS